MSLHHRKRSDQITPISYMVALAICWTYGALHFVRGWK